MSCLFPTAPSAPAEAFGMLRLICGTWITILLLFALLPLRKARKGVREEGRRDAPRRASVHPYGSPSILRACLRRTARVQQGWQAACTKRRRPPLPKEAKGKGKASGGSRRAGRRRAVKVGAEGGGPEGGREDKI